MSTCRRVVSTSFAHVRVLQRRCTVRCSVHQCSEPWRSCSCEWCDHESPTSPLCFVTNEKPSVCQPFVCPQGAHVAGVLNDFSCSVVILHSVSVLHCIYCRRPVPVVGKRFPLFLHMIRRAPLTCKTHVVHVSRQARCNGWTQWKTMRASSKPEIDGPT